MKSVDIQIAVDNLAIHYGQSVLIEDLEQRPIWWSTVGEVDSIREKTILYRQVDEPTAQVVVDFNLRNESSPVRTPEIESLEMWSRWCMPIRKGSDLFGFLWLLDPRNEIQESSLERLIECASQAAQVMDDLGQLNKRQFTRDELIAKLLLSADEKAAKELISLESLPDDAKVQVKIPADPKGWVFGNRFSIHAGQEIDNSATSGAPVPLLDLNQSVNRAKLTSQAVRAGAKLEIESWDHLGAWRLIVEAPDFTNPNDIHPAAQILIDANRPELLDTARVVLDNDGDVNVSAQLMFLHRTTLYYRIERISELIGVDLRSDPRLTDLKLSLWLASFREHEAP